MKTIINSLVVLSLLFVVGCKEQLTQVNDTGMFEKRNPIGKNDSLRKPQIDSLKKRIHVDAIITCLNLTDEQSVKIKTIISEHKICEKECKKEFNESVNILRGEYKAKLSQYRGQEKDSLIRKQIEIINFEFRQTLRDLENEYKLKMKKCISDLYSEIEVILNERQLILWKQWKETGKLPCNIIKG